MEREPNRLGPNRAGRGLHHNAPSPEQIAERLEKMRAGNAAWRARKKHLAQAVVDLATADVGTLIRGIKNRHWEVAMWHLAGFPDEVVATALGYANRGNVMAVRRRPEVARLIALVREAQVKRVIEGEFGVRAQAKAAGPKIMRRVIEKAGGIEEAGQPVRMAARDADQLRAADLVLTVAGEKVERHAHLHTHLVREMTDGELQVLAERGEWPERYRGAVARLEAPAADDAPSES